MLEEEGRAERWAGEAKEQLARMKGQVIDLIGKAAGSIEGARTRPSGGVGNGPRRGLCEVSGASTLDGHCP